MGKRDLTVRQKGEKRKRLLVSQAGGGGWGEMPLEVVDFIPEMYLLWKMCGGNDCANVWLHSGQPFWSTKAGPDESLSWVFCEGLQ